MKINVDVPAEKGKAAVRPSSLEVCQIVGGLTLAQLTLLLDLSRIPLLFSARLYDF